MHTRGPRILCFMACREKRFDITSRFERSWTSTFDLVRFTPGSFFSSPLLVLYLSPVFPSISFHNSFHRRIFHANDDARIYKMDPPRLVDNRVKRVIRAGETKCGKRNGSSIIRRMSNWNILMNVCILNNGTGRNTRQKRGNRVVGMN